MERIQLSTSQRCQVVDVTSRVRTIVQKSGRSGGLCVVYVPHTTAGVTIQENADPDVPRDLLDTLARLVPRNADYRHVEGNSDAHVKSSLVGASQTLLIRNGDLALGTWQAVFFCEFDGPRQREVWVEVSG